MRILPSLGIKSKYLRNLGTRIRLLTQILMCLNLTHIRSLEGLYIEIPNLIIGGLTQSLKIEMIGSSGTSN